MSKFTSLGMASTPMVYTPDQLKHMINSVQIGLPDGRWVSARPSGFWGLCLRWRLETAWNVFTGKWDALRWENGQ
jgi:hypothetical protein